MGRGRKQCTPSLHQNCGHEKSPNVPGTNVPVRLSWVNFQNQTTRTSELENVIISVEDPDPTVLISIFSSFVDPDPHNKKQEGRLDQLKFNILFYPDN